MDSNTRTVVIGVIWEQTQNDSSKNETKETADG